MSLDILNNIKVVLSKLDGRFIYCNATNYVIYMLNKICVLLTYKKNVLQASLILYKSQCEIICHRYSKCQLMLDKIMWFKVEN